ncbi:unnamed protein product [Cuscuta europaea]|uniref:GBF-interacting protein 1 N-terminal domain-containing protein n=1 Tax=Cuscuta europaea TaxID=41803 RepID=A0A9P0YY44_CUSEU|nr:unnamed protein product [Cuscuta europaea]
MSGKGKLINGGGGGGVGVIPAGSRKMVESLKEIVNNYPDSEIYAVLKECNMDPNEAVNRLLSQDPFHEVKNKREKRKENKDFTDSRPRNGSSLLRGGRGGADRFVGRGCSESTLHAKYTSASKKDNVPSTTLATGYAGSNIHWQPTATSNVLGSENKNSLAVSTDHISSALHPSTGHQTSWVSVPGQVSMADIVKMGRPPTKQNVNSNHNHDHGHSYHAAHHFCNDHASRNSEIHLDSGACSIQHDSNNSDEWPLIEQPPASILHHNSEAAVEPQPYPGSSNVAFDRSNQHFQVDEVQEIEDHGLNISTRRMPSSGLIPDRFSEDSSGLQSQQDNDSDTYGHKDHNSSLVVQEFSLAAEKMQQLTIHKDHAPPEEEGPSVVIPDHLQVQIGDCSHLSFGSFGSGMNATLSGHSASSPSKNHVEEVVENAEDSPMGQLPTRNSEFYGGEINAQDRNLFHMTGNYNSSADSQPDSLSVETSEVSHANQYNFPSPKPGYKYEKAQHLNVEFSQPQTSSQQVQSHASFNAMGYTNSLPSNLLAANAHALRESEISYSIFPTHTMLPKYGNSVSSVGGQSLSMPETLKTVGSSISMPEGLKNVGMSSAHPPSQQNPNGSGLTGPALPQHLNLHPYSQHTLPALSPYGNMIGYPPFLPQGYTYMPSAFQQAFVGNSAYHQPLAAMHPQYKSSGVSVSSLPPQSGGGIPSGYGSFGNTNAVSGNFQMNTPARAPSVTSLGYDDSPIPQYKDNNLLTSLQQGETNSATWLHGPSSRTVSSIPTASNYYSYQVQQHQQPGGFRQAEQQLPPQNYGSLGHQNLYHSHTGGISIDHHQQKQNPRDGSLTGGAQGHQSTQCPQQMWQNNY